MPTAYARATPRKQAAYGGVALAQAPVKIGGMAGRSFITIWNEDAAATARIGTDANVTAAGATMGIPIPPGGYLELPFSDKVNVYGMVGVGNINVTFLESA